MRQVSLWVGLFALAFIGPIRADDAKENAALLKTIGKIFDGIHEKTLPNGLRVVLKPIAGATTVTTMVGYKVGSADEELDQTGLSHYLEHLMFKGTDKLMPGDIDRMTQRNGGHNNAYTSEDMTVFHFDFAADRWMKALEVEADRMRNLRIDAKHEFEQEKGAVISELDGNEDDTWELEGKVILPVLFGKHTPYGHPVIGEKTHVRAATAEVIKKHYDRWYHPNNAVLVVVGGFDEKLAMAKIVELFGPIPAAKLPDRKPVPTAPDRKKLVREKFESKFETPRLLFGFNTCKIGEPDDFALDVIQHALTDGRLSRLYRHLVEGEELASTVSSENSTGRYPGWFTIKVELVDADDIEMVEKTVQTILKQIASDGLTDAEFDRAKRAFIANYIFGIEEVHGMADLMVKSLVDNDLAYLKSALPRLMAVKNDDIKRAARKYFVDHPGVVVESAAKPAEKPKEKQSRFIAPEAARDSHVRLRQPGAAKLAPVFDFGKAQKHVLPNGLTVLLMENHELPIVYLNAYVKDVALRETEEQFGIAHLLGNMFEEGSSKRKAEQIAEALENRAGKMSFSATGGAMKLLSTDLKLGIDVFFDCLASPTIPAEELSSQKLSIVNLIEEEEKKPNERARIEFYARAYGKHPYSRAGIGRSDIIEKLTAEELKAFHDAIYVPNNTVVAIVGDFKSADVLKWLAESTKNWKKAELTPLPKFAVGMPAKSVEKILIDANASQLHVYLGHVGVKRNHPDFFKLMVLDNILGVGPGFTDRLSANLRDRQGLAYTVNASITATASEEPGLFLGYIGTFNDKYAQVKEGFLKEINKLREEAPEAEELESAKKYLIGSLPFSFTTNSNVAGQLLLMDRFGLKPDYYETYAKEIAAVTPADVLEMAKKYIHPDKLLFVAAGAIDEKGKPLKKE